jgi:hypothetical protein
MKGNISFMKINTYLCPIRAKEVIHDYLLATLSISC